MLVGVGLGVDDGVSVGWRVPVGVSVGVRVGLGVKVGGAVGDGLGVGVLVGIWVGTRTTVWLRGGAPVFSTVTVFWPNASFVRLLLAANNPSPTWQDITVKSNGATNQ